MNNRADGDYGNGIESPAALPMRQNSVSDRGIVKNTAKWWELTRNTETRRVRADATAGALVRWKAAGRATLAR